MEIDCCVFSGQVRISLFRSCNSIKNRFFSNLRLSLRELNRQISKNIGPKKQIKLPILYKILSVCEEKFVYNSKYDD